MAETYGEFELLRLIATGGMAEIHLAHQTGLSGGSRDVVVKRMLPQLAVRADFVQMFLDEARLASNLTHPNIVAVTKLGRVNDSYYIAMELVDGPHLGALFAHSLRQRRPLPLEYCCFVVARAADGLHYAHEQSDPQTGNKLDLVHRDISPQNILVSRAGEVKVTDFGVAKASTHQTKTRTGVIKGKVAYMSPEQCLGEVVDRRTDVFALGIVLYELLTRRRLFRDKSDLLIMQRITGHDVAAPSSINADVDAELDAICKLALSRTREGRYADAAQLADALDAWLVKRAPDAGSTLGRWFEKNASVLAVTAVPVDTSQNATQQVARISLQGERTAPTPTEATSMPPVDAPATVRPEARLPARAHAPDPTTVAPDSDRTALDGRASVTGSAPRRRPQAPTLPALAAPIGVISTEVSAGTLVMPGPLPSGVPRHALELAVPPAERDDVVGDLDADDDGLNRAAGLTSGRPALLAAIALGALLAAALAGTYWWVRPSAVLATNADAGVATLSDAVDTVAPSATVDAQLRVVTVPSDVWVFVNDEKVGRSPVEVKRAVGPVAVEAKFGDAIASAKVNLVAGESTTVRLLAKVALNVAATAGGATLKARVKVDGTLKGETPFSQASFVQPETEVRLQVEAAGFEPIDVIVKPVAGEPLTFNASMSKRKDSATAVKEASGAKVVETAAAKGLLSVKPIGVAITAGKLDAVVLPDLPFRGFSARAGKHTLTLQNPAERINESIAVQIPADGEAIVIVEFDKRADRWVVKKVTRR